MFNIINERVAIVNNDNLKHREQYVLSRNGYECNYTSYNTKHGKIIVSTLIGCSTVVMKTSIKEDMIYFISSNGDIKECEESSLEHFMLQKGILPHEPVYLTVDQVRNRFKSTKDINIVKLAKIDGEIEECHYKWPGSMYENNKIKDRLKEGDQLLVETLDKYEYIITVV